MRPKIPRCPECKKKTGYLSVNYSNHGWLNVDKTGTAHYTAPDLKDSIDGFRCDECDYLITTSEKEAIYFLKTGWLVPEEAIK